MTTFPERLQALHSLTPERVALTLQFSNADDLSLTIDQLLRGANSYAYAFAKAGIEPGEVVVLILQHGEDLVYAFWGAILHGVIPSIMPFLTEKLSPERYLADLAALISVTQPAALIVYPEFDSAVPNLAWEVSDSVRDIIATNQIKIQHMIDFDSLSGFQR